MFTRVKSAVANFMGGVMDGGANVDQSASDLPLKFPYMRPEFLGLSSDEIECSADHIARPILILKETKRLPWATGYAEVINAGKSALNEDQACCEVLVVRKRPGGSSTPSKTPTTKRRSSLPNGEGLGLRDVKVDSEGLVFHYWALFDGHAGSGAAVMASKLLHHHIVEQLQSVFEVLRNHDVLPPTVFGEESDVTMTPGTHRVALARAASLHGAAGAPGSPCTPPPQRFFIEKKIQHESLVIGAIENAFKEMDAQIEREKQVYDITGGCTALCVVYLLGKLYVGNAGDSRAIILRDGQVLPMSTEFTPESERQRLQFLGFMQPHLLGGEFTHLEFPRRVQRKEVGKKMLYRDFTMNGWSVPFIYRSRAFTFFREHSLSCHFLSQPLLYVFRPLILFSLSRSLFSLSTVHYIQCPFLCPPVIFIHTKYQIYCVVRLQHNSPLCVRMRVCGWQFCPFLQCVDVINDLYLVVIQRLPTLFLPVL
ncbi:protein phosphatase 1H isoform X5 [Esox lucius]|uniref:PPM-type phosphatase domain-containing protein n=1 Tax=Esox lucius TaxID=8010 RepID=A0AAY5KHQ3_ESOLU|nr:protein phosphatase 1H isoform X5 [Esox lucius]